ncbi:LexA family transcriptional regulator [Lutibacter sp. HS1-25]|uniref:LexA family protein n=1 Tax=Lutibacter sp. HS1-25 TaxID=2485000 RepID=UPI001011DAD8|nr:LexA family transcriptional regulator [Lutibacter sp. HS1-25]
MRLKKIKEIQNLTIFIADTSQFIERPIVTENISAGFPSPAEDFKELRISLDKELVKNENATFYARVRGNSMIDANIEDGDLLVIDRSIETRNGKIAVCMIDGEFTVKRLKVEKDCVFLMPENKTFKPIKVTEENELIIWGIVTYVIKKV